MTTQTTLDTALPGAAAERRGEVTAAAADALAAWNLDGAALEPLGAGVHHTFRVDTASGRRVLRLYGAASRGADEVRSEQLWLCHLRDAGLSVPAPVPTADGAASVAVDVSGEERRAALYTWVPGETAEDAVTAAACRRCGELMARLHRAAEGFTPPPEFRRPRHDADALLGAAGAPLPLPADGPFTAADRERFATAAAAVRRRLEALGEDGFGLIHGDLQVTNLLLHRGRAAAIDFADFGWGWYLYDLAAALLPLLGRPDETQLRDALLRGYTAVRPLSAAARHRLDLFLLARALFVLRWSAEHWHLPSVRATGETAVPRIQARLGDFLAALDGAGEPGGGAAGDGALQDGARGDGAAEAGGRGLVDLFAGLKARGIRLWEEEGKLRFKAPAGALDDALRGELAARKAEVLAFLRRRAGGGDDGPAIEPLSRDRPRDRPLPTSFAQERLWVLDRFLPGSAAYNIAQVLRLDGELDVATLHRCLAAVVARHEALRTTFSEGAEGPVQVIRPAAAPALPRVDLSALPPAARRRETGRLARAEARRPFDLAAGPLHRFTLLRSAPRRHRLLLSLHHIVSDGWSSGVLVRELVALYPALAAGEPSPLPPLPVQYADFAAWQRRTLAGEALERQVEYWRRRLDGAPDLLDLPTDRPRPPVQTYRGDRVPVRPGTGVAAAVDELARRRGATPFMVLLAAFQALLVRLGAQRDVVVGSPVANRQRPEVEGLVGFFVNTLALRTTVPRGGSFAALVDAVRETTLEAFAHQDVPFEKLVDELHPQRNPSHTPFFQTLFVFQNSPMPAFDLPGLRLAFEEADKGTAKFDLVLTLWQDEGLEGTLNYNRDLFDRTTARRMAAALERLLSAALAHPGEPVDALPLESPAQRHQTAVEWNDTTTAFPADRTVPQLFAEQVARRGDAPAVSGGGTTWSYRELDRRSATLAAALRRRGVGPESRVALLLDRSPQQIAWILAVLRAGGAYVPLDPLAPPDRQRRMLLDSGAVLLITAAGGTGELDPGGVPVLAAGAVETAPAGGATGSATGSATAGNLAYVIYTSGSTGDPKGVAVSHRSVARLVRRTGYASFAADRVFLQLAPVSFDASTFEIWGPLLNGAHLVVHPGGAPSPESLEQVLAENRVTTLWLTAGLFHLVMDERPGALVPVRELLAGGDVLSADHVRRFLGLPGRRRLVDGYGPTEGTTFTCCQPFDGAAAVPDSVPIGRPIANTRTWVVDPRLRPRPLGVAGELVIGGHGLARGYLGDPRLTAERFVPDPLSGEVGGRLYRTGDLVRHLADGRIDFLGRFDHQVKVRGFRVELGEIEAALTGLGAVSKAVVLTEPGAGPAGDLRLVAYLVPAADGLPGSDELRAALGPELPSYMLPSAFVAVDALPLTANGKVDRRALARIEGQRLGAEREHVAPRTALEEELAALWEELLHEHGVGVHDDFFDRGGNSLLATQVVSRLRRDYGVDLPLAGFFAEPTVAALATAVEVARRAAQGGEGAAGETEDDADREVGEL